MFFSEDDIFGERSGCESVYLSEHTSHIDRQASNELSDVFTNENPIQSTRTDRRRKGEGGNTVRHQTCYLRQQISFRHP